MPINYLEKYRQLGVRLTVERGPNAQAFCPFHEDKEKPSFSFNVDTGLYKCFVPTCSAFKGGNFKQAYQFIKKEDYDDESLDIPEKEVLELHAKLLASKPMLSWLEEQRGISIETVKRFKLGFDGDRLCIPVYWKGRVVNIRKHHGRRKAANKVISYKPGYGGLRLFPEESLASPVVLLCEGELDTILACQLGYSALTVTGGSGSWADKFTPLLKGKEVIVCYDIDEAGKVGAKAICNKILGTAGVVKNLLLPITSPATGDLTDYVVQYGATKATLDALISDLPSYTKDDVAKPLPVLETLDVELAESSRAEWVGRPIRFRALVAGKQIAPFGAPKDVKFACSTVGKRPFCFICPIATGEGKLSHTVPPQGVDVLRLINVTEDQQRNGIRKSAGVPPCDRFRYEIQNVQTVEEIRLIPEISFNSGGTGEYTVKTAYHVGHGIKTNNVYQFEGTSVPDPATQAMTYVVPKAHQVKDTLENFKVTDDVKKALTIFQVGNLTVAQKMDEIVKDLTYNVTKIYEREPLIKALDLVFHSVLGFSFQKKALKKGWTECLVLGDTRCGKTETITNLVEHYKAGEISSGENTSFAGLIGGLQQMGNNAWTIMWGKLPLNDRRLYVIDEISGMAVEDIGKMSGVRSSGIAEIVKVQTEKTFSRTRLVWLGNPRSNRSLATYDAGVMAIQDLIGRPEDIARFDIACTVASGEVALTVINQSERAPVPHRYTSELCHQLVLWAWSRRADQVHITKEAEHACLEGASAMSRLYSSHIPLVEPAEQRIKIIRLATAAACRVFSTTDGETVTVGAEHVRYAVDLLNQLYNSPSMNYGAYSKAKLAEAELKDPVAMKALVVEHGAPLVEGLLAQSYYHLQDFEDIFNMEKRELKPIIATLIRNRALKKANTVYVKTPAFIQLLRKIASNGALKEIKEEF